MEKLLKTTLPFSNHISTNTLYIFSFCLYCWHIYRGSLYSHFTVSCTLSTQYIYRIKWLDLFAASHGNAHGQLMLYVNAIIRLKSVFSINCSSHKKLHLSYIDLYLNLKKNLLLNLYITFIIYSQKIVLLIFHPV
jgi:hypothetical protein